MKSVFLDTDIILDVFTKREPFYEHSAQVLSLAETRQISGSTSSLIFANLYYILRRLGNREQARFSLIKLRSFVNVLPVDSKTIDFALQSSFSDFEDAIQYATATSTGIPYLITRNIDDYKAADRRKITVCTPPEYLAFWNTTRTFRS